MDLDTNNDRRDIGALCSSKSVKQMTNRFEGGAIYNIYHTEDGGGAHKQCMRRRRRAVHLYERHVDVKT